MKKVKFNPTRWQTYPYSLDMMNQLDAEGRTVKDLVMQNRYASKKGISEMIVNIDKLAAVDSNGKEHFIANFSGQKEINLKGIHAGWFIRSKSVMKLNPGEYHVLRFYLHKKGNSFSYSDRSWEPVYRFTHLDFEIQDGLKISDDEASQVILRFDFEPYRMNSYFKSIQQFFEGSKSLVSRLTNSLGQFM